MSTSQPIQEAAIQQYARQLYLTTVADQFASLAEEAVRKKQSHLSYLEALLEAEIDERDRRAVIRRIKEAHFPAVKTLEEFDFQSAQHIPAALLKKLSEGEYLERKEPVIFLGETGTGKSHLATALGVAACRQRKRVRFTTAAEMVTEMIEAQSQLQLTRVRSRWMRYELVVVDEARLCGHAGCRRRATLPGHRRTRRTGSRNRDNESSVFRMAHQDTQRAAVQGDAGPIN